MKLVLTVALLKNALTICYFLLSIRSYTASSLRWASTRPEFRDTLLAKQALKRNHLVLKMSFKIYL